MTALALPLVVLALALGAAWAAGAVLYPAWAALIRRVPGAARGALLVALLPVLIGVALGLAAVVPGDPHQGSMLACHCATSVPGWLHLCPVHPAASAPLLLPALAVVAALLPGRLRALGSALATARSPHRGEQVVAPLPRPTAVILGWLRPTVVVDDDLWTALAAPHREAVLAHEHAHVARRDPLVLGLLRTFTAAAPAWAGAPLVAAWSDRAELLADRAAAHRLGDPLQLAEALVRCARLQQEPVLSWTGGRLERRVQALLDHDAPSAAPTPDADLRDLLAAAGVAAIALAGAPRLHHALEHLLNYSP